MSINVNDSRQCVLLLNHAPNPRMLKRVAVLRQSFVIHLVCLRRLDTDIWDIDETLYGSVSVIERSVPSSDQLIQRLSVTSGYAQEMLAEIEAVKPSLIYTEGLDCLAVASRYKQKNQKCRIIFEVADLRAAYLADPTSITAKMKRTIVSLAEKRLYRHIDALVVTSELFYDEYFSRMIPNVPVLFAPNAPDPDLFKRFSPVEHDCFTVGFIGGIRYPKQMAMLIRACESIGCKALLAGAPAIPEGELNRLKEEADPALIEFSGKYSYANDILDLYGRVDCVYAVYDADDPNVRIALPNKLYEAVDCELPIIVAKGTYLAQLVDSWGVGIAVSHFDQVDLERAITALMREDVRKRIQFNCRVVKQENVRNNWQEQLLSMVENDA